MHLQRMNRPEILLQRRHTQAAMGSNQAYTMQYTYRKATSAYSIAFVCPRDSNEKAQNIGGARNLCKLVLERALPSHGPHIGRKWKPSACGALGRSALGPLNIIPVMVTAPVRLLSRPQGPLLLPYTWFNLIGSMDK